ncbi:type VI secretion system protein TssA [Uliginosibacterium sp. 31-16]|uniref:type VI secretion system protein TssA n=1 Tax=Uliginosibacterium sp. 31-16 TaxID=3068315 RepID=UPI00273F87FA|nr:type VI secretion system protein TssA [Uliginosibacterium sp. 31-16]MDP5240066.1 type VI secretion system protein TssA [Uliginosibacterium sp. 31-16]
MLGALGGDAPCGLNLEYDAEFLQLEEAARAQPEQEFANADTGTRLTIEGQGANWADVRRLAQSLLQRTRDLRVATYYTRALLRTEGFGGLAIGLKLIHGLLEAQWDYVHPQLDPDDGNDPTMRVNALMPLVAMDAVLGDLRAAWVLKSRQAVVCVRDIEVAQGRLSARDGEPTYSEAQLAAILGEAAAQDAALADSIHGSVAVLDALSTLLQDRVGASASIDFKPLRDMLQGVRRALPDTAAGSAMAPAGEDPTVGGAPAVVTARPGEIASRQDVVTALERMIQYLERAEPTNPAQLLLRRAQRVMNMNFLEAMNELAPDGLVQAERSVGSQLPQE